MDARLSEVNHIFAQATGWWIGGNSSGCVSEVTLCQTPTVLLLIRDYLSILEIQLNSLQYSVSTFITHAYSCLLYTSDAADE